MTSETLEVRPELRQVMHSDFRLLVMAVTKAIMMIFMMTVVVLVVMAMIIIIKMMMIAKIMRLWW